MKTLTTLTLTALLTLGATSAFAQQGPGAHFIENFDENGDGQVTLDEMRTKRAEIFYMLDQNEDGILDSGEYDLFDATRAADQAEQGEACDHGGNGAGNGPGKGRQGEGMARGATDLNGDGQVTREEFLASTDAWFAQRDRNGDGQLDTSDFGRR